MARYFKEQDIDEFRECFYLFARSGQITSLDELTVVMRSLGMSPTIQELTGYLKGKGGKMSFADFLEVMHVHSRAENLPHEIQDDAADIHGLSQQSISRICKRVAKAILDKRFDYITMPNSMNEQLKTIQEFEALTGFKTVIGAIDCTHIRIPKVQGPSGQFFINRKGYSSLNVQVVNAFKAGDIEKRGSVPAKQLRNLLQNWGEGLSSREVDNIFREANVSNNGTVRYEDFVKIACAPVPDYY